MRAWNVGLFYNYKDKCAKVKRLCRPVRPCSRQVQLSTSIWVALIHIEWLTWFSPCISSPITEHNDRLSSLTWQKTNRTHTHTNTGVRCKTVKSRLNLESSSSIWICVHVREREPRVIMERSKYVATVTKVNIRLNSSQWSKKHRKSEAEEMLWAKQREAEGQWQRNKHTPTDTEGQLSS